MERRTRLPGVDHEAVEAEFCLVSNMRSLDVFKLGTQGSHGHMEGERMGSTGGVGEEGSGTDVVVERDRR